MSNRYSSLRLSAGAACLTLSLLLPCSASADALTLAWDANPEVDVVGYYVFIGTEPGVYSTSIDVGNVTSYTISATPGATYYLTVAAYAPGPLVGSHAPELVASVAAPAGGIPGNTSNPVSDQPAAVGSLALAPSRGRAAPVDSTAPTLTLTNPTTRAAYATTGAFVTLSGRATDDMGVQSVTWTSDRGGYGDVAGTTNWSVIIPLQTGANVLTVTAVDGSANLTVVKLTVTASLRTPTPSPTFQPRRRRLDRP